eukprot:5653433-Pyramimonas_sp.AAC.1
MQFCLAVSVGLLRRTWAPASQLLAHSKSSSLQSRLRVNCGISTSCLCDCECHAVLRQLKGQQRTCGA